MIITQSGDNRPLTSGERDMVRRVFGDQIDPDPVRICRRKWFWFQPVHTVMAPMGHVHFHPGSTAWREDFSDENINLRALFIHEMTHIWQTQNGLFLPLLRHPFCRYRYTLVPGKPFARYGVEQQAEIVKHAYVLREGYCPAGIDYQLADFDAVLPF